MLTRDIELIDAILDLLDNCVDGIMELNNMCVKNSELFNSSKTETIASSLVYHYLVIHLPEFDEDVYFRKSSVSKDTILAINAEILKYSEMKK